MNRNIQTFRIDWNGIAIEIRWEPNWLDMGDGFDTAHLQIESVLPERAPLPVTETGYRSHFTSADTVASYGGPAAFVEMWLAEESRSPAWRAQEQERRQMSLF
jgi:hypothetical protein